MKSMRLRVLTGCQMEGLVSALRHLFPTWDIEGFHSYRLLGVDRGEIHESLRAADLVFSLPLEAKFMELSFDRIRDLGPQIQFVPHVVYSAFHPDITYVDRRDGTRVHTPMIDYNSIIAVAAFRLGLNVAGTLRLYNAYTYQALGYFDLLRPSGQSLLSDFDRHGIELREALPRWLQSPEPFMYSMNHPRSFVLADVALAACRAAGLDVGPRFPKWTAMPDRLAEWVVYPVFKEIAARLGKVGGYGFRLTADRRSTLSLGEYVAQSFGHYEGEDLSKWEISERIDRATTTIGSLLKRSKTPHVGRPDRAAPARSPEREGHADASLFAAPQYVASAEGCFFYHTTNIPELGTQSGPWDLRGRFSDYIGGVDLTGQRVLDVGTASGFLSFSAEEAGAREVVSFDLDNADRQHLLPFAQSEYVTDHAAWSAKQTAAFQLWKNAYWLTHRLRKSKAKVVYGDIYAMPEGLGQFDVVILGAILEHLADPLRALASIARHARKYIVINTDVIDTDQPVAQFNGRPEFPDKSYIFWTYSLKTYEHIMGILGYEIVSAKREAFLTSGVGGAASMSQRAVLVCRRRAASETKEMQRVAA